MKTKAILALLAVALAAALAAHPQQHGIETSVVLLTRVDGRVPGSTPLLLLVKAPVDEVSAKATVVVNFTVRPYMATEYGIDSFWQRTTQVQLPVVPVPGVNASLVVIPPLPSFNETLFLKATGFQSEVNITVNATAYVEVSVEGTVYRLVVYPNASMLNLRRPVVIGYIEEPGYPPVPRDYSIGASESLGVCAYALSTRNVTLTAFAGSGPRDVHMIDVDVASDALNIRNYRNTINSFIEEAIEDAVNNATSKGAEAKPVSTRWISTGYTRACVDATPSLLGLREGSRLYLYLNASDEESWSQTLPILYFVASRSGSEVAVLDSQLTRLLYATMHSWPYTSGLRALGLNETVYPVLAWLERWLDAAAWVKSNAADMLPDWSSLAAYNLHVYALDAPRVDIERLVRSLSADAIVWSLDLLPPSYNPSLVAHLLYEKMRRGTRVLLVGRLPVNASIGSDAFAAATGVYPLLLIQRLSEKLNESSLGPLVYAPYSPTPGSYRVVEDGFRLLGVSPPLSTSIQVSTPPRLPGGLSLLANPALAATAVQPRVDKALVEEARLLLEGLWEALAGEALDSPRRVYTLVEYARAGWGGYSGIGVNASGVSIEASLGPEAAKIVYGSVVAPLLVDDQGIPVAVASVACLGSGPVIGGFVAPPLEYSETGSKLLERIVEGLLRADCGGLRLLHGLLVSGELYREVASLTSSLVARMTRLYMSYGWVNESVSLDRDSVIVLVHPGSSIELYIDDVPAKPVESGDGYTVYKVARGAHKLSVRVVGAEYYPARILLAVYTEPVTKTETVTVHDTTTITRTVTRTEYVPIGTTTVTETVTRTTTVTETVTASERVRETVTETHTVTRTVTVASTVKTTVVREKTVKRTATTTVTETRTVVSTSTLVSTVTYTWTVTAPTVTVTTTVSTIVTQEVSRAALPLWAAAALAALIPVTAVVVYAATIRRYRLA